MNNLQTVSALLRLQQRRTESPHAKESLSEAISKGGSTLRDYVDSAGQPGYFQLAYYVYGREGEPCRICGTPIRGVRQGGRATSYCAHCQR